MATITLKNIPDDVHAQLMAEAEANHRSLDQEAVIRIQRSFDVTDQVSAAAVDRLIAEALASGPAEELTEAQLRARFQAVPKRTRQRLAEERPAR